MRSIFTPYQASHDSHQTKKRTKIRMTIQQAIRSGKPFRRKMLGGYYGVWHLLSIDGRWIEVREPEKRNKKYHNGPRLDDILATDWEIKL